MYLVHRCADYILGSKAQLLKVTAGSEPKTLWIPYLKNQQREFYPILVTDVNELIDVLISFWVTKSNIKVTAGNDPQKPCEQHISKTNVGSFT